MSNGRFLLVVSLAAALCFAAGLAIAKRSSSTGAEGGPRGADGEGDPSPRVGDGGRSLTAMSPRSGGGRSPAAQFSSLNRSPDHGLYQRMSGFFRLIAEAEPGDMPALVDVILREMPEDLGGEILLVAAGKHWAQQDPTGALRAVFDGKSAPTSELHEIVLELAPAIDPQGAWQEFLDAEARGSTWLKNPEMRSRILTNILSSIGNQDIDLAIELYTRSGVSAGEDGMSEAILNLARWQPLAMIDRLEQLPFRDTLDRDRAIEQAFESIGGKPEDIARAREHLESMERGARLAAERGLARAWAQTDPEAALEWADGLGLKSRQTAKTVILHRLINRDIEAAAEAVLAESDPHVRERVAFQVARDWGKSDRDAALVWVRDELEGKAQHNAYSSLLEQSMRHVDFEKDFEILKEMADGDPGSSNAHYQFAERWARSDPQAAAEWAMAKNSVTFSVVARHWMRSDPAGLRQFAATLEDEAMSQVVDNLITEDERRRKPATEGGDQ